MEVVQDGIVVHNTGPFTDLPRRMEQHGWITGPVECRCSNCLWSRIFEAEDMSVPTEILEEFEQHNCVNH